MFMALASLMTDRTIRSDTAMTGEISLRGLVLPVGGIKEKVVAAHSAGIKRVMLPARNRRDYDDIPEAARREMEFIWLERVEDAVAAALEPKTPAEAPRVRAATCRRRSVDVSALPRAASPSRRDRMSGRVRAGTLLHVTAFRDPLLSHSPSLMAMTFWRRISLRVPGIW